MFNTESDPADLLITHDLPYYRVNPDKIAGEPGSGKLLEIAAPARATIISTTSAVTIGGGVASDTLLRRIIIGTALAGTLTITGFQDETGAAKSLVLPIATPAGSYEFGDVLNEKGALTITLSSATDDDDVMVIWVEAQ